MSLFKTNKKEKIIHFLQIQGVKLNFQIMTELEKGITLNLISMLVW